MSVYQQWSLGFLRDIIVREELMDSKSTNFPNGRWWSDTELNYYSIEWQAEIQQQLNLLWGTFAFSITGNTPPIPFNTSGQSGQFAPVFIQISSMVPQPERIDAFYWNGWRLSGRLLEDLEVGHKEWRAALPDSPRMVVQYDSRSYFLWPTPAMNGVLECEYPVLTTFTQDGDSVQIPFWTQFSAKPYICALAYSRPGPTNDLKRAARYRKQYEAQLAKIKITWANYNPYRYRKLKPASHYEWDILKPPPAMGETPIGGFIYVQYALTGTIDGTNTTFTIPVVPNGLQVFKNGLLQSPFGNDYILSGSTIVFTSAPLVGDTLTSWAVNQLL